LDNNSKIRIIPTGGDLIEAVADAVVCDSAGADKTGGAADCDKTDSVANDLSGRLVVFPGRRPAHFLRKSLGARFKRPFIPPAIYSMDEFVDHIYADALGIADRPLESIDAAALLYEINLHEQLGAEGFSGFDAFFPLSLDIFNDLEEFVLEQVAVGAVRDIDHLAEESIPEGTLKTIKKLSTFYERFYEAARTHGRSTRSMRYGVVAQRINEADLGRFKKVVFAGFYALSKCERMIFEEVLKLDNASILFEAGPEGVRPPASMGVRPPASMGVRPPASMGLRDAASMGVRDAASMGLRDAAADTGRDVHQDSGAANSDIRPVIRFYKSPDTHGQIFALASHLEDDAGSENIAGDGPGYGLKPGIDTVIVIPSADALFPLLRQCLSHFDEADYNVSLGYPLHRTPVYAFLNSLMELVSSMEEEKVYVPAYLKFVLHPYTKNIHYGDEPQTTRIMFHALEEALVRKRTQGFMSLQEIENLLDSEPEEFFIECGATALELKAHLRDIHQNTVGEFIDAGGRTPFADVGDFAARCAGVLTYIYGAGTARMQPFFHPFVEEFLRHLRLIGRSLLKDMRMSETSGYFNLFRRYMATARCPFAGTPLGGMQALGLLETRNLRFKRVFVLDVNEDVLPVSKREDSVLPFKARKILGLPTYQEREAMSAYYFHTLISGAESVRLYFVENDRRQRSRFIEKLIWERQKTIGDISDDFVETVQYNIDLTEKRPESIKKSPPMLEMLRGMSYSSTALDAYLRCPLEFYHRYVLNLREKERSTGDIERADIGLFVHAVLAEFFRNRMGRVLSEADFDPDVSDAMDAIVERRFKTAYGEDVSGAAVIMKSQVKKHLREFLTYHQAALAGRCRLSIIAVEKSLSATVFLNTSEAVGIKGRVDRIEKRGDTTYIIDYKTSSDPGHLRIDFSKLDLNDRNTWPGAIGTLQLPFYMMLYAGRHGEGGSDVRLHDAGAASHDARVARPLRQVVAPPPVDIRDVNAAFILLGRSTFNDKAELALFKDAQDAQARFNVMKTVITGLLSEIIDPEIPFYSTADGGATPGVNGGATTGVNTGVCRRCSYRSLCGI
jgi:hypothetical protein